MVDTDKLGGKIGPRIASLIVRGQLQVRHQLRGDELKLAMTKVDSIIKAASQDTDEARDVLAYIANNPNTPEWSRRILGRAASSHTSIMEGAVRSIGLIVGLVAVFGEVGRIMHELTVQDTFEDYPWKVLPPESAASAVAQGIMGFDQGAREAKRSGFDEGRFGQLVDIVDREPNIGETLQLLNRGHINEGKARNLMRANGVPERDVDDLLQLRRYIHEPAALAEMAMRNVITDQEGAREARKSGMTPEQFDQLVGIVGQPPGLSEMLFMLRRGIIDEARLERGIRQSRYRDEWIDDIKQIRFRGVSGATAAQMLVQGFVNERRAKRLWAEDGLDPDDFEPFYEMSGDPPGVGQMLELWNRGLWSDKQIEAGLRESRVKNKYIEDVKRLGRYVPPPRSIPTLLRNGAIDKKRALELFRDNGLSKEMAQAYVDSAIADKTAADRDLAKSEVITLYDAQAIDEAQARDLLSSLGYDDTETSMLLSLVELRRERRFYEAAISRVRSLYVAYRIDDTEMQSRLDQLNVPPQHKANLIFLWGIEREANQRDLTAAQITGAMRRGHFDEAEARTRLQAIGYTPADADALIVLASPAPRS